MKYMYSHHHWGTIEKSRTIFARKRKVLKLISWRKENKKKQKPGDYQFNFDSFIYWKLWVKRKLNKGGIDEVVAISSEQRFWKNERNQWGGRCFETNDQISYTSTENNRQEIKNV